MSDLKDVTRGDQLKAPGLSTFIFAVWTIFSIFGVKTKPDLGLSETEFGSCPGSSLIHLIRR